MTTELFTLTGHVAIVTGSSRGIGLAIARQFLKCGANVVVSGHDPDETSRAREALQADFPADVAGSSRVTALAGDVSDPDYARNLVKAAHDAFGRLDAVVCNAGIDIIKPATDYDPAEWDRVIAINLKGVFCSRSPQRNIGRNGINKARRSPSLPRLRGASAYQPWLLMPQARAG